jgi:hypothetical protein
MQKGRGAKFKKGLRGSAKTFGGQDCSKKLLIRGGTKKFFRPLITFKSQKESLYIMRLY